MATATAEQRFALTHAAGVEALAATDRFADATPDMLDAILDGADQFATGTWQPLDRIGDTVGARWTPDGVVMPDGFRDAYRAYVAGGWGTIGSPVAFGGQGMPFAVATAVLETLGTANLAFALAPTLTAGAVEALVHHGSADQQARFLPRLATGEWTGTMNLTEPQAGSDVGALTTRAEPHGDGTWRITGTKIYISFGDHDMAANIVHLVLARTPGAPPGTKGISLFLVPKFRLDAAGEPGEANDVHVVSIEHKMGLHASPTCVLSFGDDGDCRGERIGAEGGGMRAMFTMMNNARLNVGLQGVQVAEAATRRAVAYARDRVQSPRASAGGAPVPIIEHPDVRRMLLRMTAQTMAARALVYYAAGQVDRATLGVPGAKARLDLATPLAKAHGTDIGCEVASIGIQVHGGIGYIEETGAARHFRDARITPIYEGTNGIQAADLVGRKLTGDGGAALEALFTDMIAEIRHAALSDLLNDTGAVARWMLEADTDDRLAGSYPFLTMLATTVCGWLLERQGRAAGETGDFAVRKRAAVAFYLDRIVPEARGLGMAAMAGADGLYRLSAEQFATD